MQLKETESFPKAACKDRTSFSYERGTSHTDAECYSQKTLTLSDGRSLRESLSVPGIVMFHFKGSSVIRRKVRSMYLSIQIVVRELDGGN